MAEEKLENQPQTNADDGLNELDDEWAEALAENKAADEKQAQQSPPSDEAGLPNPDEPDIQKAQFEDFGKPNGVEAPERRLEMLMDVVLPVSIELGRTRMYIKEILELERGSVIELDKMAGEPVDLYINNKKMAEGEVVVVDKHFGVRITNLINPADRIKNLGNSL